jgi:hypothetical protein
MICNVRVTFETVNVLAQLFTTWVVEQYCWTRKSGWPAAMAVQRFQLKVNNASSPTHARNRCTILQLLGHCNRVRKCEGGLDLRLTVVKRRISLACRPLNSTNFEVQSTSEDAP